MGVTANMDAKDFRVVLNREAEVIKKRVIAVLQYVGEKVVNDIRDSHISSWLDRSGNLRSSIGYIISVDGMPLNMSAFEKVSGPVQDDSGLDGSQEGINYARRLVTQYPRGIALIVVAGMEYASYVERRDNKVVLAQGELEAQQLAKQMITELKSKMK